MFDQAQGHHRRLKACIGITIPILITHADESFA
jgi:hypothetical protein